ncbi:hypothetical protein [Candidatus Nitrosocosmicus sp. SS]|jgi:hypothetical protein|nr:hypothetical protein [Candidatus Nitrosocosmicus sp. SS]
MVRRNKTRKRFTKVATIVGPQARAIKDHILIQREKPFMNGRIKV